MQADGRRPPLSRGLAVLAALVALSAAPEALAAPTLAGSPWPTMRHDLRNTGASAIRGEPNQLRPWSFVTGRGIFSTPVVDDAGTVYVGSADGTFYALGGRTGERRWRFRTGGIIDAAAALGPRRDGGFPITIGSGDETLYQLRSGPNRSRAERVRWRFRPPNPPATGQLVNWWEGNPAYGPDGNLYVGNTGGGTFSLTPGGEPRWEVQRANSVWTTPAFDAAGNSYWGSVDFYAFSLDPAGELRWQTFTPGYVTSSPALGSDGTVYVGSFDRNLYALDPATGQVRWSIPTADHIYGSPALSADAEGRTSAIYVGSADGSVYAVSPDGTLLWRYDTGDPVRSSPVLGRAPRGGGRIVYVGSSNGKLYALDAESGRRRWSFDTTPSEPALADRNDLNGSPALGRRGVYIGGEHGRVWFVPYDFCRRAPRNPRCETSPAQELGSDLERVLPVTPGGSTLERSRLRVPAATVLGTRLVVRRDGTTLDAAIEAPGGSDALVTADPPFDFDTQLSGDGHFLFIRPRAPLDPGALYRVRIAGEWAANGERGSFDDTLTFRTERLRSRRPPLHVRTRSTDAVEISRLALPQPSLLPSVNQIGFDSYDLIAGTIARSPARPGGGGSALMWVVGARREGGRSIVDPDGGFAFPLYGAYRGNDLSLNASGVSLEFSFGPVPLRSFDFRGALERDGGFAPGASVFGQVTCGDVPNYSVQLQVAGVCNSTDTLASFGTFLGEGYSRGGANERPAGVGVSDIVLTPPSATDAGEAVLNLSRDRTARLPAGRHLISLLLTDEATGAPVPLDYRNLTTQLADDGSRLTGARLELPAGTELPPSVRAYAIADVFPLGSRLLEP